MHDGRTTASLIAAWKREAATIRGDVSVLLRGLHAPVASSDAARPHYAASTIKLGVAIAAFAAIARGDLDASSEIVVRSSFPSGIGGSFTISQHDDQDDPTWCRLGDRLHLSLLVERMIVASSNIATNLVLQMLDFGQVQNVLADAGADDIKVCRLIGDDSAQAAGLTNTVTAEALAQLVAALATGQLLPPPETRALLDLAARRTYRRLIPAGLPEYIWSAGKAGWTDVVKHDVAIVRPANDPPYILAICVTAHEPALAAPIERSVSRVSALSWKHWSTGL